MLIFFVVSNEQDLIILSALSKILIKNNYQTNLLVNFDNKRLRNIYKYYRKNFTNLLSCPNFKFSLNFFCFLKNLFNLARLFNIYFRLKPNLLVEFDIYEPFEFFNYLVSKLLKIKTLTISAYETGKYDKKNYHIDIKNTLISSLYTFLLTGRIYYCYYNVINKRKGFNYFSCNVDCIVRIEKSGYRNYSKNIIDNFPYPLKLTNIEISDDDATINISGKFVLLLVNSFLMRYIKNYREVLEKIIKILELENFIVIVKDHPNVSEKIEFESKNVINFKRNEISAELIMIRNFRRIVAVIGHGTTSLVNSSYMGILSIDILNLLDFNDGEITKKSLKNLIKLSDDIIEINAIDEILYYIKVTNVNSKFNISGISNNENFILEMLNNILVD